MVLTAHTGMWSLSNIVLMDLFNLKGTETHFCSKTTSLVLMVGFSSILHHQWFSLSLFLVLAPEVRSVVFSCLKNVTS